MRLKSSNAWWASIPKATRFKGPKAEKLQAQGAALFERLGHPPEKVAKKIADGILKNKARVLIGPETYVFDAFKRALPVQSDRIISQLGFLGERR